MSKTRQTITVELDSPTGPRLTYRSHGTFDAWRLVDAAPAGYQVDWSGPLVRLGRGRFAMPLRLEQARAVYAGGHGDLPGQPGHPVTCRRRCCVAQVAP